MSSWGLSLLTAKLKSLNRATGPKLTSILSFPTAYLLFVAALTTSKVVSGLLFVEEKKLCSQAQIIYICELAVFIVPTSDAAYPLKLYFKNLQSTSYFSFSWNI